MIDYKKLGRIGLDSADQQKVDTIINVSHQPLVSQYDKHFIKYGYIEVKENKYHIKMSKRERDIFQITKIIADTELAFAYRVVGALLSDTTEENLRKEIELVREDAQVEILRKDKINNDHKKLNGKLREEIEQLKLDKIKAVEDVKKEADKKMMNTITKYENALNKVDGLRKKGLI